MAPRPLPPRWNASSPPLADAPALRRREAPTLRYGHNPAHGQNPIFGVGGVFDLGYGYGGRAGHGEAAERPLGLHAEADPRGPARPREPWPQEVYERRRQEQVDFLIALRAGIEADVRLGEEIRAVLDGHEGIDAATIVVVTERGEVTLYGAVEDEASRRLAADLVEPLWGVTAVHNFLRVRGS